MKVEKLTVEQEKKLVEYREKWLKIGLATGPVDRKEVEQAVDECYQCVGMDPPRIKVWVGSPFAGCIAADLITRLRDQVWAQVGAQVGDQVGDQVWAQVRDQVWDQVWAQVGDQVRDQVWAQVGDQVWDQVWAQVRDQVRDQVWAQVGDQVGDQVRDQVRDQVGDQVWAQRYRCGYGQQDANWLAFCHYLNDCNIVKINKILGLIHLAEAGCGWWWPFTNLVILSDRPSSLVRDEEHRLHCEDGPALLYPDGFAVYEWHGVRIERWIIEEADKITPELILTEQNQEIRRVMLERYGWPKMLKQLEAQKIHEDRFGILYETDRLGQYLDGEDACAQFVHVIDPSTGREYALRVPPTCETAQEAVAWTFGYEKENAEMYQPIQES